MFYGHSNSPGEQYLLDRATKAIREHDALPRYRALKRHLLMETFRHAMRLYKYHHNVRLVNEHFGISA